ncbi:MAG: hypothetical protein A4E28_01610 [Methanocella sp. PtaU1.Bin125]|nr:MAG: hypothetical protein A4E28_01610 [Methanocella sp. PtaU1.Bin125]
MTLNPSGSGMAVPGGIFFSTARPRWCSDIFSATAALKSASSSVPLKARTLTISSSPRVSVPVLSSATMPIRPARSRCEPPLIRTPWPAALPMPDTTAMGVEMTRAPGHEMTSSVSATSMSLVTTKTPSASRMMAGV